MSYGIKISKPTFNVRTADPKDLVLSSEFNSIKIKEVLQQQFNTGTGVPQTFEINHNLGYTPGYHAFVRIGTKWYGDIGEESTTSLLWISWIDDNKFYIYAGGNPDVNFTVRVYLMIDESNDSEAQTQFADPYGVRISKPGIDVRNAYDQQLVFASNFLTFKHVATATFTYAGSGGDQTVAHGLNFIPAWIALVDSASFGYTFPAPYLLVGNHEVHVWSDDTNIGVRIETILPGGETATIKVAVFDTPLE